MNNRTLLLIFLLLLAVYGLTRVFSGRRTSSFRTELIKVDTAAVTSIAIDLKGEDDDEITLKRENQTWIVTDGARSVPAMPGPVNGLLQNLALIGTQRVAAKDPGKWPEYEVGEEQATRVRVYQGQKVVEDFLIGRFSFNQQAQSGTTYVRLTGEDEVYAVDGFQMLSFNQNFDAYRDHTVLRLPAGQSITGIDYQLPDTTYRLARSGDQWLLNGIEALDSVAVANYLTQLRNLSGDLFADDFDELRIDQLEQHSITIHGDGGVEPVTVHIYRDTTRRPPFVIRSSQYPQTFFASDSTGLLQRVYQPLERLKKD